MICRPRPIRVKMGESAGIFLMSDLHIGAADLAYHKLKGELQEAKERGDRILVNGDVFDAILPGDRKRFVADVLHPRLIGRRDIMTAAIDMAVELLGPVVEHIDMLGVGNHDTAVEKYHSFDPVNALIDKLHGCLPRKSKHKISYGGYGGFVRYSVGIDDKHKHSRNLVIGYHHGHGGAAPVTKGMIDFNRLQTWMDADVYWIGHKHNKWAAESVRVYCPHRNDSVKPVLKQVRQIHTGSYYQTYHGQSQASVRQNGRRASYASDAAMAPQGMGGIRLVCSYRDHELRTRVEY